MYRLTTEGQADLPDGCGMFGILCFTDTVGLCRRPRCVCSARGGHVRLCISHPDCRIYRISVLRANFPAIWACNHTWGSIKSSQPDICHRFYPHRCLLSVSVLSKRWVGCYKVINLPPGLQRNRLPYLLFWVLIA